jgi:hypothetical protein
MTTNDDLWRSLRALIHPRDKEVLAEKGVTKVRHRRGRRPTIEEFATIARHSNATMRRLLLFARETGLRPYSLRWQDVDLAHATAVMEDYSACSPG